jgi:hypothetical protein
MKVAHLVRQHKSGIALARHPSQVRVDFMPDL